MEYVGVGVLKTSAAAALRPRCKLGRVVCILGILFRISLFINQFLFGKKKVWACFLRFFFRDFLLIYFKKFDF